MVLDEPPVVSKLTVGREASVLTGFPLFHNYLVVDAVTAVFPFGMLEFRELREQLWLAVMGRAAAEGVPGLIFTFAPERTLLKLMAKTCGLGRRGYRDAPGVEHFALAH